MSFLGVGASAPPASDALAGLFAVISRILAYGAVGIVVLGILVTGLCDLFENKKWRRCHGRTEFWGLMH